MRKFHIGLCAFMLAFFAFLFQLPPVWGAIGYTLMTIVTYFSAVSVIERERVTESPTETTIFSLFFAVTWPVFYFFALCFFLAGDR